METWEKWEMLKEIMGSDDLLQELYNYISNDEIEQFIENVIELYNLERGFFGYDD